ncbi:MAG: hypothetical protein HYW26_05585 [Candidatus Aenigmarchaeota archaeon]|nr:hypothetical protein [Candidatus Aenigmarchaeota archaeon]
MKNNSLFLFLFVLLLSSISFASSTYEIQLVVSKYVFGPAENVSITGTVLNITSNSTLNITTYLGSVNVNVSMLNSTNGTVSNYTFTTNENGTFFSRSSFNPSATAILSPNATGTYILVANSSIESGIWISKANIVVVNSRIDDILFQLAKINFYASENMSITVRAVQKVGDSFAAVSNITINMTMMQLNESIISSYTCVTSASGTCAINTTAPSASGTYILEANNFVGFTNFKVVPFDVEAYMKDSSALVFKNIFTRGETGFVEVRVSYNSTTPTGVYNATGDVIDTNGNNVLNLTSVLLNSSNGFVDKIPFTASSSLIVGFYTTRISVAKQGGETVNATTSFQVRDWSMSFKKASQNSGFEYGYTAFVGKNVSFEAYPTERANGTVLQNLTSNFTILLKNPLGSIVGNTTVRYNASCGGKACYEFNLAVPSTVGDYTLSVAANYSGVYESADQTIKATDITATSYPSDSEGNIKELFGTTEFVYISLSGKNVTSNITIYNAALSSITYDNGTQFSYSETNVSSMNFSDATLQWAWNSTAGRLQIDPPKTGGVYLVEVYANNKSAVVTTRFGINPYDVCASAKGTSDTSTSDYWYQFRTSDTIYFQLTINEAQNPTGKASLSNISGNASYGRGTQCSFDTTKKRSINNATVTIENVFNTQTGKTKSLNTSASTCSATDNSGGYICTVQPDGTWDGGRHVVTFNILGDDKITYHKARSYFEARAFYVYGYSTNWANKGTSNISLNVNVYEAGSGWWTSSNGLSGTAVVDSINFYGGVGEWIWPPIKYDYNATGLNMTITNGVGSVTLPSGRSSSGIWAGGYYSAVIKVTVNSQVDYGEAWFSIRNWDAYAQPVEIRGSSFDYKNSLNARENVSLYVRITEASNWNDNGGTALGNVTINVKKILDYSQWPPVELTTSNFTATPITINTSSPWFSSANTATHGKYLLNISPTGGTWSSGYYSVVLDLNGTESGYGWFNVITFYVNTQPTNANGSGYVYNNKGNTPIYFNVTTTKSQKSSYTAADYVNATITEAVIRMWDQTTQSQREFRYPGDINITPLLVNGTQIINVTYLAGNWPSGWYNGEIKMRESVENTTSKGYIWFSVQPFRVSTNIVSYNVGTTENASVSLTVNEPDWYNSALINGNYTVTKVQETSWTNGVYRITNLNYSISSNASTFRNTTTLVINPTSGKWRPGYKSGTIIVKDNLTNDTQTAWFWFRVTSFIDSTNRISSYNVGLNTNITVNITLTTPAGAPATGNLSSAFYWGWPSKTRYRFVIGSCDSQTSTTCFINRSAIVTIVPPANGWNEGYNYIYFEYVEQDDASSIIESYNSVYFYAQQTLTGYMYSVDDSGGWKNSFGQRENVTMFVYSLRNVSGTQISVNVTNVQIAKTSSGCWSDSCRVYQNATFEAMNLTSGRFTSVAGANMTGSGYIRINASGGLWDFGDYAVKIFVTEKTTGEIGIIKDATFRIIDRTAPSITITSPTAEQVINATSILFTATTTEQAVCYIYIYNYGQYNANYCGSNGTSLPSACNLTKYDPTNSSTAYFSYASKWWSNSGVPVSTDSTSHSYNHSTAGMTTQQNYTVYTYCYDNDWNSATNATTFNLIGGLSNATSNATGVNGTFAVVVSSPANTTYASTNISLNYSIVSGTVTACWYKLNNASNVTLTGCGNSSFTASSGANNVTVYATSTNGTTVNSSIVRFTLNMNGTPAVTVSSPANTSYSFTNISLSYSVVNATASACWYRLNSNTTNVTLAGCGNSTFTAAEGANNLTIYANSTGGTTANSSLIRFTVTLNNFTSQISVQSPTNTTYTAKNITLNFTWTGNITTCTYNLTSDEWISFTTFACGNTSFLGGEGSNKLQVNVSNSSGSNLSAVINFTVDTNGPNITFVAPTASSGAVINVNHTFVNITLNEAADVAQLEFNGTNYSMTNLSATKLLWFRNQTGLSIGNYTYKVYANDTFGNTNVTASRTIRINATA